MDRVAEVEKLREYNAALFDPGVCNILNGQCMYEEFKRKKLMGDSDYAPFNEAMCVHATTSPIFGHAFIQMRASGHNESIENYHSKVVAPFHNLFQKNFTDIVLWFGEDMFCQMNLLTILAYLEQSAYKGNVYLNSFQEDKFKVSQIELTLGTYFSIYEAVLVHHEMPSMPTLPVMYEAILLFLEMQSENNPVTSFISKNSHLPTTELLKQLFDVFPEVGFGDTQYLELIDQVK